MKGGAVFIQGIATGFLLQLAIGPVFIFIVNTALQSGVKSGLAAVVAVTVVDYLYITLAILGTGKFLEVGKRRGVLTLLSSAVLIVFGFLMIRKGGYSVYGDGNASGMSYSAAESCVSAFILTISSPLTIVFWTGVFTAKAAEYSFGKRDLMAFGLSAGGATLIFLGFSVVIFSSIKVLVPAIVIQGLNVVVGALLIGYGLLRIKKLKSPEL